MTDKQQIEDMAMLIEDVVENCEDDDCPHCSYRHGEHYHCSRARIATALYNAGYRKVDENAVVLTREEFDRLNSCIKSEEEVVAIMEQQMLPMVRELTEKEMSKKLATVTALERKATAQEFLYELIKYIDRNEAVNSLFFGGKCLIDKKTVVEIAKQFGVEVEQ